MAVGRFTQSDKGTPPGTVLVWTDDPANIPTGWAVCDGNNGTPDLTDKMLRGVNSGDAEPGDVGGQNTYSLASGQLPSHSHSFSSDSVGDHNHSVGSGQNESNDNGSDIPPLYNGTNHATSSNGSHSHTLSMTGTGSGNNVENRPSYTAVLYIMRL